MNGEYKKFDKDLFESNDKKARAAVMQYVFDQGLFARHNDDKYGPDLIVYSGFRKVSYIEVEIKRIWKGLEFPWESVQLPERKGKFLKLRNMVEFWILNADCNRAICIPETSVTKARLKEVPNSQIQEGEMFYVIPIEECNIIDLESYDEPQAETKRSSDTNSGTAD